MAAAASSVTVTHVRNVCLSCEQTSNKILSCMRCHVATYCSKECQVNDWKQHKPRCKKIAPATPPLVQRMRHLEKKKAQVTYNLVSDEELKYISSLVHKSQVLGQLLTDEERAKVYALSHRFEYDPSKPAVAPSDPPPLDLNEHEAPLSLDLFFKKVEAVQQEIDKCLLLIADVLATFSKKK